MQFFKKLFNGSVKREKFAKISENSSKLSSVTFPEIPIMPEFESDFINQLSFDGFIDATLPENIAKYKNNLRLLVNEAKKNGKIDKFMLIRNDDFFPHDWEWNVASQDTCMEKVGSSLSYAIRQELARRSSGMAKNLLFDVPLPEEKMEELLNNIDKEIGLICQPVRYRSTKHFTVNTPLSYTGEYNNVNYSRNFHIIDSIDNFLSSGYAYSSSYKDAYLDVTHESLKLSDQAIVLIDEKKYNDILKIPDIKEQLEGRRIIIFKGDEALAINMILTELGVLPSRPGNRYMQYDNDTLDILDSSMREVCENNSIEYDKGHGNIYGKGGHFSDLYDGYNQEHHMFQDDFTDFLKLKHPEYSDVITPYMLRSSDVAYRVVKEIGIDILLEAITEYNNLSLDKFNSRYKKYKDDRKTITPEISFIFKTTVQLIASYYKNNLLESIDMKQRDQIESLIKSFYHSNTVESQLLAANVLMDILEYDLNQRTTEPDVFMSK